MRDAQVVKLRSKTAGRTTVNNAAWISTLGNVVSNCFDCCYYVDVATARLLKLVCLVAWV